jgi:hypothetical protein
MVLKEGHFYRDPRLGFYYFCDKISGDIASWVLIESYQHGHLIQARFNQSIEASVDYEEVASEGELARLWLMLEVLNNKDKETEFLNLIKEIDEGLKKRNVPIFRRPLDAIRELCMKLKTSLPLVAHRAAIPGLYSGESLVAHVHDWYERRYGDRLKTDFSPGQAAVLIKGDPWKVNFPSLFGKAKLVFDPDFDKYRKEPRIRIDEAIIANPLSCIDRFTVDIAKSLTKNEMSQLAEFFMSTFQTLLRLFEIKDKPFIPEARVDLDTAVNSIFLASPNYGQSRWASLQFAEKILKSYLKLKKASFPKKHDLELLSGLASINAMPTIAPNIIQDIQCYAGVRYGEIAVTLQEAIKAHHSSLKVCSIVAPEIKKIDSTPRVSS